MTNDFDEYVDSILESYSLMDLPDAPPYGFWISPGGEFFVVRPQGHTIVAREIIQKNPQLIKDGIKPSLFSSTDFLMRNKYIRVAKMTDKEYTADIFYYSPDDFKTIIPFEPTTSAKRTLNDIGDFYNMRITYMKR